jgi:hypothetical protein
MAKTIVIGDIHGCYEELRSLLKKANFGRDDRVVAVGDLTVKGPKNREVLALFAGDSRFSSVMGNQDLALVKHWQDSASPLKPQQDLAFTELEKNDDSYLRYLSSLPFYLDLGSHVVVHAGLRPGVPLEKQTPEDLTELRTLGEDRTSRKGKPWYEEYAGPKFALFGHWPTSPVRRGKYALGLDTGCVYGYELTAYVLETREVISVPAEAAYAILNSSQ